MKTKQLWAAVVLATGIFTGNAQTNVATSSITSRGLNAGTLGTGNAFFGYYSGNDNTATGVNNTFIGQKSGKINTTGDNNVFMGADSGILNTTGAGNVYIGYNAASTNNSNSNVIIGSSAGAGDGTGNNNTFVGAQAGTECTGSSNVLIGYRAAEGMNPSNELHITSKSDDTPLIWGDFASDLLKFNGKVGIGIGTTAFPTTAGSVDVSAYKLFVKGGVLTEELRVVAIANWADYVFEDGYKLRPLSDVEYYIEENGHLPNVPSAKQVADEGINVGEMAKIQQEKIEELTLYLIEQNKQLEKQQKEIDDLKVLVQAMADKK